LFGILLVFGGIFLGGISFVGLADKINGDGLKILVAVLQVVTFLIKTLFFCWLFIWVRWTLPRFRYDQLMRLGWKIMIPLALLNIIVTSLFIR
jgi:NADH-quinone oxidoreductase subunit H